MPTDKETLLKTALACFAFFAAGFASGRLFETDKVGQYQIAAGNDGEVWMVSTDSGYLYRRIRSADGTHTWIYDSRR